MPSADARFWVGFQHVRRIGPVRLKRLIDRFGSISDAWTAPQSELRKVLDEASVESIAQVRASLDLDREMDRIDRLGIGVLTLGDATFPALLREVPNPPAVLYVKGTIIDADLKAVGMVGTRRCTGYGRQVAATMAEEFAGPVSRSSPGSRLASTGRRTGERWPAADGPSRYSAREWITSIRRATGIWPRRLSRTAR